MDEVEMPQESIDGAQDTAIENPMELNAVIKCIFKYTSITDIKKFRFVSRGWNSISEPFLRSRCKISFHKYEESERHPDRTPSSFVEIFGEGLKTLPFHSFKFSHSRMDNDSFWTECELSSFCHIHSEDIKELEFSFVDIHEPKFDEWHYDMTDLISNSALVNVKSTDKWNTKLKIESDSEHTLIEINLEVLKSIKEISLAQCQVTIPDSAETTRIQPISLHLKDIKFFRKESFVERLCLNDIVDWSRILDVTIDAFNRDGDNTEITLDSEGFENGERQLKSLSLRWVEFLNAETFQSEFQIQKLKLLRTPFVQRTKLVIKEFEIHKSKMDLCALPICVEKLSATESVLAASAQSALMLPNLKSLILTTVQFPDEDLSSFMSRFVNCRNLVNISLTRHYYCTFDRRKVGFALDVSHIPQSVKRMKLKGVDLHNVSKLTLKAETLILGDFSLTQADTLNCFQTDTLVLTSYDYGARNEEMLHFLMSFGETKSLPPVIYVGPFVWLQNEWNRIIRFENSPFAMILDEKSHFYMFRNGRGCAITHEQFQHATELE